MIYNFAKKVISFFNIHADRNQKPILISLFVTGLLLTYINPRLVKTIISELPAEWIAFQSLFGSVSGLVIGMLWKGSIRVKAMRWFFWLCVGECTAGFVLGMWLCFISFNVWVFAIVSLIYTSLVTQFVAKCIMAFKTILWKDRERELYDNNTSIVSGIVCIIGFGLALMFMPSLEVALFLWGLCCAVDDLGWMITYTRNKQLLKKSDV